MLFPYPIPLNRLHRHWKGRTVVTPHAREWRKVAQDIAREETQHEPITAPLCVILILHPRMNKDGSASKIRLDIDAFSKWVLDCMQGIVYENDSQVVPLCLDIGPPMKDGGMTMLYAEEAGQFELIDEWLKTRER